MLLQDLGYTFAYIGLGAFTGFVLGAFYGLKSGKTSGKLEGWIEANKELLDKIRVRKVDLSRPYLQTKPLVLIVEDNEDARELMASSLKMYGYRVVDVGTGAEGLVRMEQLRPQTVILDIKLPDMDGVVLALRMRVINPKVKLVAVTGFELDKKVTDVVDTALQKPYDIFTLIKAIEPES